MKHPLDDAKNLSSHDPNEMLAAITRFPLSARKAIRDSEKAELGGLEGKTFKALLVAGMGGSAVGGLLLRDWLADTCKVPIAVSRGYHLPAWVDRDTLVYAVSYSGNTEETLQQYQEAVDRGCQMVCFCSGGKLSQSASRRKIPRVRFPKGYQPRAAIAFQFFSLATVSRRLGLVGDDTWEEVNEAVEVARQLCDEMSPDKPTDSNPCKALAESVKGYTPFVYGSRLFEAAAYRYGTQFNENSKSPAAASFFPEAFHNSVMAREAPPELLRNTCAVILRDPKESEETAAKISRFTDLMAESFGRVVEVEAHGEGRLARIVSALLIGDHASAYLGILYGRDPSSTDSIRTLKGT